MRSEYSQSKYNSENSLPLLEEPVSCASPRVQNSSRKNKLLSPGLIISNNSASWHTENVEVRSSLPSQGQVIPSGDAIQRNVELEALCAEQAVMIKQLSSQINLSLEQNLQELLLLMVKKRNGGSQVNGEEFENEKQRWMESEEGHGGIAEVKKAAAKVGSKGKKGSAFASALAAELATSRIEREKERAHLKHENRVLKLQLRDTAEAVHAAGELLVRLREAEEAASATQEKYGQAQQETEKLRRQMEKLKKKHAMEMATMKHYLAESRLPESALEPLDYYEKNINPLPDDDMSWRSAFRTSYQ
ncbi:hypothetical protein HPP92_027365 [Vanilla planifolia]|uniref:Uncharacterized protein n=1 Tax=Vanilla planifolia TaxID=51239 RepID=A0A835PB34_VANPL|nr:hypothetical protein HPP92_027365 [Vanilla planifolia]